MTIRSLLLALSILAVFVLEIHGAEGGALISLRNRDLTIVYKPVADGLRPGHADLGGGTSLYHVNSAPTNPVWLRIMGEAADLYRIRVDDPRDHDPNSTVLGLQRWIGPSVYLSGMTSSVRGNEEFFHLRDQEKSITQMLQIEAAYLPENGLIASAYATVSRTHDVPPGRDDGIAAPRRFNRNEHRSLTMNAGAFIGYGRTLFSAVRIRASAGLSFMRSAEDHQYRLDGRGPNRVDSHSAVATTTIPLDLTVRYHKALSDDSHLLFESSVGMNHTLKVHEGTTAVRMTAMDGSAAPFAYMKSFDSMKNIVYMGAAVGYRRERLAAWLRYDQGRHGPMVTHLWTATLGWSF